MIPPTILQLLLQSAPPNTVRGVTSDAEFVTILAESASFRRSSPPVESDVMSVSNSWNATLLPDPLPPMPASDAANQTGAASGMVVVPQSGAALPFPSAPPDDGLGDATVKGGALHATQPEISIPQSSADQPDRPLAPLLTIAAMAFADHPAAPAHGMVTQTPISTETPTLTSTNPVPIAHMMGANHVDDPQEMPEMVTNSAEKTISQSTETSRPTGQDTPSRPFSNAPFPTPDTDRNPESGQDKPPKTDQPSDQQNSAAVLRPAVPVALARDALSRMERPDGDTSFPIGDSGGPTRVRKTLDQHLAPSNPQLTAPPLRERQSPAFMPQPIVIHRNETAPDQPQPGMGPVHDQMMPAELLFKNVTNIAEKGSPSIQQPPEQTLFPLADAPTSRSLSSGIETPAHRPVTPATLPAEIVHLVKSAPDGPVILTLTPEDLGTLRFQVTQTDQGMHIHLVAENPDMIDLLRRQGDQLLGDLRQAGFPDASLSFSGDGAKDAPGQRAAQPAPSDRHGIAPQQDIPQPLLRPTIMSGALDLRL